MFFQESQTGIPDLRRHCHMITAPLHRVANKRRLRALENLAKDLHRSIDAATEEAGKEQIASWLCRRWKSRMARNQTGDPSKSRLAANAVSGIAWRLRNVRLHIHCGVSIYCI